MHPGLCISADRAIYEQAKNLAKYLERHFTADKKHSFHFVCGSDEAGRHKFEEYFYFAHKRGRTRKIPMTHVFIRSDRSGADISLADRAQDKFAFVSPWTIAKEVLRAGCSELGAVEVILERLPSRNGTWTASEDQDFGAAVEIWPSPPAKVRLQTYTMYFIP